MCYLIIDIMTENYNSKLEDIEVYILPSIDKCHFEVQVDVYNEFKNSFNNIDKYTIYKKDIDRYYIDTKSLNRDYLISLGINKNNIYVNELCSVCEGKHIHSYRFDKEKSGRNLAVISL